jgi:NADPH-dependent FMN reductase
MGNKGPVRVLAIAGHSPRESSSSGLLGAVGRLATDAGAEVSIYRELEALPLFSQDLDGERAPAAVVRLRAALRASDAVLISSPEYVHGDKTRGRTRTPRALEKQRPAAVSHYNKSRRDIRDGAGCDVDTPGESQTW